MRAESCSLNKFLNKFTLILIDSMNQDSANNLTPLNYLKNLWIIRVWTYQKGPQVIQLEFKSNTSILDEYGKY